MPQQPSDKGSPTQNDALFERAQQYFQELQMSICQRLEQLDGRSTFRTDEWERPGGGGGRSRVIEEGAVFEKGGVNWSLVDGQLPGDLAEELPGQGTSFRATGVSLVIHPLNPMVPTTHANFRCIQKGDTLWFGGGADLTPYYLFAEDATHFHRTLKDACAGHEPVADYARFKTWCDDYFFIKHRGEARGVGGIFFDYLKGEEGGLEATFDFVRSAGDSFVPAYAPIVERRVDEAYGDGERNWQLQRRGRYVEFNLVYDRGTVFGLKTAGRIESILMSLPPLVRWDYCAVPEEGTREATMLAALEPRDWAAG